jgi:hypothetical protein
MPNACVTFITCIYKKSFSESKAPNIHRTPRPSEKTMQKHLTTRKIVMHSTNLLQLFKFLQKSSTNLATF